MVKELHAEHGDDPADDLNDNDTHHDGHSAAIDGGKHLAPDNRVDRAVAKLSLGQYEHLHLASMTMLGDHTMRMMFSAVGIFAGQ